MLTKEETSVKVGFENFLLLFTRRQHLLFYNHPLITHHCLILLGNLTYQPLGWALLPDETLHWLPQKTHINVAMVNRTISLDTAPAYAKLGKNNKNKRFYLALGMSLERIPLILHWSSSCSFTVSSGSSESAWEQYPVRCRFLFPVRNSKAPEVGSCSPVNILKVVLLPAPLSPRSPKHWKLRWFVLVKKRIKIIENSIYLVSLKMSLFGWLHKREA